MLCAESIPHRRTPRRRSSSGDFIYDKFRSDQTSAGTNKPFAANLPELHRRDGCASGIADTSVDLPRAVQQMLDMFNNELGGADEPASINAKRVMSNFFNLPVATNGHSEDDDEATTAARELANAFATIEQYRDYIPARIYNGMIDWIR